MNGWEIFCRVVDNLGDVGVCWRLARQLVLEKGLQVRLWVDDLACLAKVCQKLNPLLSLQFCEGVEVALWSHTFQNPRPAAIVIEAFACELPAEQIAAMRARHDKPIWLNLEYLSAEPWVETCHGLPSPQTGHQDGLRKYFFFPGFSKGTGGLIREAGIGDQRAAWSCSDRDRWLSSHGIVYSSSALLISLFTYENPAILSSLFSAWSSGDTPVHVLVAGNCLSACTITALGIQSNLSKQNQVQTGALTLTFLPLLSQEDYDHLLWCCDLNFVRGEDSFVRAQWAARPFVWHVYPQKEGAHWVKLRAFLDRYLEEMQPDLALDIPIRFQDTWASAPLIRGAPPCMKIGDIGEQRSQADYAVQNRILKDDGYIRDFWLAWNGAEEGGTIELAWKRFAALLPTLHQHAPNWADRLAKNGDLASHLVNFAIDKVE